MPLFACIFTMTQVLDANGKGKCTAHAATCGHGNGVFFLLQECIVVLMHGTRAAYLPAPYVDRHGEKHGQFRGRPLHLDQQRLNLLRNLVAMHEVCRYSKDKNKSHVVVQSPSFLFFVFNYWFYLLSSCCFVCLCSVKVPARVVHSRSTSHKIIIPNYCKCIFIATLVP
jgi:hypothetical protein